MPATATPAARQAAISIPTSPEAIAAYAADFIRQGYVVIPDAITPEVCAGMRSELDRIYREYPSSHPDQGYGEILRGKLFHYSTLIRDHIDHAPIIDVVEAILGKECHLIGNNSALNDKAYHPSPWHVDDDLMFPLPEGVEHDDRVVIPCHALNTMWYLTDVGIDDGPTQVVPFSHRAGRHQPLDADTNSPTYRGNSAHSIVVKAGSVALQHSQIWHRRDQVRSDKTRYLLQYSYGRRSFSQRMYPFVNCSYPDQVLEGASPRLRRLLGFHERGAWG
jgi:hypothetical protein